MQAALKGIDLPDDDEDESDTDDDSGLPEELLAAEREFQAKRDKAMSEGNIKPTNPFDDMGLGYNIVQPLDQV